MIGICLVIEQNFVGRISDDFLAVTKKCSKTSVSKKMFHKVEIVCLQEFGRLSFVCLCTTATNFGHLVKNHQGGFFFNNK